MPARLPDPPARICPVCNEAFPFDRKKHVDRPSYYRRKTCGKKACRYEVAASHRRILPTDRPLCAADGCCNHVKEAKTKYCSLEHANAELKKRRWAERLDNLPKRFCERCDDFIVARDDVRPHVHARRRWCSECIKVVRALRLTSHEHHMAKKAGHVRRLLSGEKRMMSDEHRANLSKSFNKPSITGKRRIVSKLRQGMPRESF